MNRLNNFTTSTYFVLFLTGTFLMSVTSVNSQNWLQNRQQWTYSVGGGFLNPSDGLHTLSITGDTTIANKDCKILTNLFLGDPSYQPKSYFVYTEEEAVYSYDFSENDFIKMYDFSMAVGDSVVFTNNKKYKVDSIGTMGINTGIFVFSKFHFSTFLLETWDGLDLIIL